MQSENILIPKEKKDEKKEAGESSEKKMEDDLTQNLQEEVRKLH